MSTFSMHTRSICGLAAVLFSLVTASCASAPGPEPADIAWPEEAGALDLGGSALVIHSGGLEECLADPRDAGWRRALAFLDQRLAELPGEFGGGAPPPGTVELLCEVLCAPWTLRVDLDGEGPVPVRAEWVVRPESTERAPSMAARFAELVRILGRPSTSAEEIPTLTEVELPGGSFFHGTSPDGGAFVLAWGEPRLRELDLGSTGLPAGARPTFVLGLDVGALLATVRRMLPAGEAEAEKLAALLDALGLGGEGPLRITLACGHDADRGHVVARQEGWVSQAERMGGLPCGPMPRAALDLVPADATVVSISRSEPTAALHFLETMSAGEEVDPLEMLRDAVGLDLGPDLLEPLGETVGYYLSDTTGGGGLLSAVVFAEVDDEERLRATLESLAARLDGFGASQGEGRLRVRAFEHGEARGLQLDFPGLPVPASPALAIHGGFLLAALTPQGLAAALDCLGGTGEAVRVDPRRDWRDHLPRELPLDDLQALLFADTPRLAREGYGLASLLGAAVANALRSPAEPARDVGPVMPPLGELLRGAQPTVMLTRIQGNDLVTRGTGDPSASVQLAGFLGWTPPMLALLLGGTAAAVITPAVNARLEDERGETEDEREVQAFEDLWRIRDALEGHASEHDGRYPASLEELLEPDAEGLAWLEEIPLDPWGNEYVYYLDGDAVRVLTYGADGVPGGEGAARDLTSDELDYEEWEEEDEEEEEG